MSISDKFFTLLRLGLNCLNDEDHSLAVSAEEWSLLYNMAQQQGVLGVVFAGIERFSKEKLSKGALVSISLPPRELLLQWFGVVEQIKKRNMHMNRKCVELHRLLESVGLESCILKGQGVAQMYPEPQLRQSGDIDIWCRPHIVNLDNDYNSRKNEIIKRLQATGVGHIGKVSYLHAEWDVDGFPVEIHFNPSFAKSPATNSRLQRWFADNAMQQMQNEVELKSTKGTVAIPTDEFNAIYLLHHIYRHLFQEGIGLRQVCDYYMLLSRNSLAISVDTKLLKRLDILWFARAMMWVLSEVFHLPRCKMFVEPDERAGRFVLNEILRSGNFGVCDTKYKTTSSSKITKWTAMVRRNFSFLRFAPCEVLWYVPFKLFHKIAD